MHAIGSYDDVASADRAAILELLAEGCTLGDSHEMLELIRQMNTSVQGLGSKLDALERTVSGQESAAGAHRAELAARLADIERRADRLETRDEDTSKTIASMQVRIAVISAAVGSAAGIASQAAGSLFGG